MKALYFLQTVKLKILRFLASFLTNETCLCCGKKTFFIPLCKNCIESKLMVDFSSSRCSNCGKVLISEEGLCTECRENPVIVSLDKVFPIFTYRLWNKEILYRWKTKGNRNLVYLLSEKVFEVYSQLFPNIPIVPIPPRPGKLKKRGWDQINDLTKTLKTFYSLPVLHLLKRTETTQQKKLTREERLAHKGSSYILSPKLKDKALPKEVVLIDDILTTGVTLETCASILKKNGVEKVYAITLFIVD